MYKLQVCCSTGEQPVVFSVLSVLQKEYKQGRHNQILLAFLVLMCNFILAK